VEIAGILELKPMPPSEVRELILQPAGSGFIFMGVKMDIAPRKGHSAQSDLF